MEQKTFMSVQDVADEIGVSKSYAYKIVKQMNKELQKMGYITVSSRVNTEFFKKKMCYSEQ
ncbi:MAG: helix-turn-helix domain-containing protein [Hespellia sp.]|nr:helix-turn-helix domain-containing protein [Hespellia sp.]